MLEKILLPICVALLTVLTFLNLRRYRKYRTSFIPVLVGALMASGIAFLYIGKSVYAYILFLIAVLMAIVHLPNVWQDWVKILKHEKVDFKERMKLRDYLGWTLFIKLGYRLGVGKAALLYALNWSAVFAIAYCIIGSLLSIKYSCEVGLAVGMMFLPVNYHLARKTIEGVVTNFVQR